MFSSESFHNADLRFESSIETGQTPRWMRKSKVESCDGGSIMKQNRITTTTPSSTCRPKTPRKTPGSSSKTPSKCRTPSKYSTNGDRFIPNRNRIDFDNAHFKLVNEGPKDNNSSPSKDEEERIFKENLNPGCSASKILSFRVKAPASEGKKTTGFHSLSCRSPRIEGNIGGYQNPQTRTKIWNNPKTRTKNWENPKTRKCKIKNPKKCTLQQKTFTGERLVSSFFDISLHWLYSSTKEQFRRLILYG